MSVLWFRRDLRLADNPALLAAAEDGPVTALFVLDPVLLRASGAPRTAFLVRSLTELAQQLRHHGGDLVVRSGRPEQVVPEVARAVGAGSVHISADFGPYGAERDARVEHALDGVRLVRTGSPYAVAPGRVTKADGSPYKVYSAFYRGWREHGWRAPAHSDPARVEWGSGTPGEDIPPEPDLPDTLELPPAGEQAALRAWHRYRRDGLASYPDERDRPDLDRTSRMSVYLHFGAIHPRTLLHDLGARDETYRKELAWREFYAAVLHF